MCGLRSKYLGTSNCTRAYSALNVLTMRTIEKLGGDKFPEQINVPVDRDLKERAKRLKQERRINVTAEIRKAIRSLFDELEQMEAS